MARLRSLGGRGLVVRFGVDFGWVRYLAICDDLNGLMPELPSIKSRVVCVCAKKRHLLSEMILLKHFISLG